MKRVSVLSAAMALSLTLTACGGGANVEGASFDPAADAQTLLDTQGVFSAAMVEIDAATACALYGIDAATVESCAVYASEGSAEELAIFAFADEDAAAAGARQLGYRVTDRTDELRDYMPGELTKLTGAVVETRGASALLVIAADYSQVTAFLEGEE